MKCCTCENSHSLKNSYGLSAFVHFPTNLFNIGWLVYEFFKSQKAKSSNVHDLLYRSKVRFGIGWLWELEHLD